MCRGETCGAMRLDAFAAYVYAPRTGFVFALALVRAQDGAEITISALEKKKLIETNANNLTVKW